MAFFSLIIYPTHNRNSVYWAYWSMIKIHILHTGKVRVSPALPFGGDCCIIKASGITTPQKDWLWLPVSAYLIEHPRGIILVDCGWHRDISPDEVYDKKAQIKSLGSRLLYRINQGVVETGATIDEQLETMGLKTGDIDYVLLTHLDCDHANGLRAVADAKHIMVSRAEMEFATNGTIVNRIRYQSRWWRDIDISLFDWNGEDGPFSKSYDLFGDGSVVMINIPGHSKGLCAVKIKNTDGKFALLFSDGGYATKSWKELITSGIADNKKQQLQSLKWIREQSMDTNCVESLANHDPDVQPHTIIL